MLRSLHCPDLAPASLEDYVPPLPSDFVIFVQAEVGPSDGEGSEVFGVSVCSPDGLSRTAMSGSHKGFAFVRHRLVVERWDTVVIRRAIEDICRHSNGDTWDEVARKLGRYMHWEFEDYEV